MSLYGGIDLHANNSVRVVGSIGTENRFKECSPYHSGRVGFPAVLEKFLVVRDRQRQSSLCNRKGVLWDFGMVRY